MSIPPFEQRRIDDFIAKAERAEAQAAALKANESLRDSWLAVAASYRELAAGVRRQFDL
ncbi:MAG TPA: hypothetical protein VGG10_05130 [Rhizomicrobium sp.]|jgi:hypothetical protein